MNITVHSFISFRAELGCQCTLIVWRGLQTIISVVEISLVVYNNNMGACTWFSFIDNTVNFIKQDVFDCCWDGDCSLLCWHFCRESLIFDVCVTCSAIVLFYVGARRWLMRQWTSTPQFAVLVIIEIKCFFESSNYFYFKDLILGCCQIVKVGHFWNEKTGCQIM
jgi:hypothetical protein